MTEEEAKIIENFKKFIKFKEDENDYLYESEEFYKDDIEQNELLLKMLRAVLNIIQKLQEEKEIHIKLEQQYKKEYLDTKEEAEKKDKIIKLLVEECKDRHYNFCDKSEEEIIQYYENKAIQEEK